MREVIDFESFKKHFIDQPKGFYPVYSEIKELYDGTLAPVMQIDMICEWRLPDGKVKFIEVPFDGHRQFEQIIKYLKVAANLLNEEILIGIDSLKYVDVNQSENKND